MTNDLLQASSAARNRKRRRQSIDAASSIVERSGSGSSASWRSHIRKPLPYTRFGHRPPLTLGSTQSRVTTSTATEATYDNTKHVGSDLRVSCEVRQASPAPDSASDGRCFSTKPARQRQR